MGLTGFQRRRRELAAKEAAEKEKGNEVSEELAELRERGKELGIPRASQMGVPKLTEAIAAKEAELQALEEELLQLRIQAIYLGIEDVEEKDYDTLSAEIAVAQSASQRVDGNEGGEADGGE